ncbi:MAG: PEP-CTERM sorting domain-containing protein [Planctomycetota bacterium]
MDTMKFRSLVCCLLIVGFSAGMANCQTRTVAFTLSIAPALEGLPVSIEMDTLTPELGIRSEDNTLQLEGSIDVELDYLDVEGQLVPQSLRFVGGEVSQENLYARYKIEVGQLVFASEDVEGRFETLSENRSFLSTVLIDDRGIFDASQVTLTQDQGSASVVLPQKLALGLQSLGGGEVAFSRIIDPQAPTGRVDLEMIGANDSVRTYAVDLSFEMFGRQLQYDGIGLPTSLNFEGGSIAAVGTFTIPEPSTAAILMLATTTVLVRRRYLAKPGRTA